VRSAKPEELAARRKRYRWVAEECHRIGDAAAFWQARRRWVTGRVCGGRRLDRSGKSEPNSYLSRNKMELPSLNIRRWLIFQYSGFGSNG